MALSRQIHLYSIATDAFYTKEEKDISDVLSRLYKTRSVVKKKYKKHKNKQELYMHQLARLNKIIKHYKYQLIEQFKVTESQVPIRTLRNEAIVDKNVVSIFESSLTRALEINTNELTKDLMIVQVYYFEPARDVIKNGFYYNDEKYVLFSSSAGQIRTKKFVVIKESALNKIKNKLTCGLNWDIINDKGGVNANKYLAYYSLNNSATDIWDEFNIDRAIVVEDFEAIVTDQVDYIDDATYKIERKLMDVPIPHTDGCGIKLNGKNQMIRLPWFKGLMGVFKFDELVLEWREEYGDSSIGKIKDIYGKEYDIIDDDIEFIFTKSQFKMWKYYDSWDEYKNQFKMYQCEACTCNIEEDYIKDAKINYQMLQTLSDITPQEMTKLAGIMIDDINNLGNDYRTMKRILGVNENNPNLNAMQKSLLIYPELMRDKYNRQILKDCKTSLVKDGKCGKFPIKGKYTFVLPDLYAFCEWLFLNIETPKGLLSRGEVSCSLYYNGTEIDCLRSPHLYKEHAVRKNVRNEDTERWFNGKAIYTSTDDLISKYLMFDVDGDKLLTVSNKLFCKIAKRNMNDIVPLYYDMKKAPAQTINGDTLFDSLEKAYKGGKIGIYSNNISKIWNSGEITQDQLDIIKMLCMENNFCIDMAKTLYMPKRPKDIDKKIKEYTRLKLPHFFIYAKDKDKSQVDKWKESPINMLEHIIPDSRLNITKTISRLDYRNLLSNKSFELDEDSDYVVEQYDYWNKVKPNILKIRKRDESNDKGLDNESFVYNKIREELLSLNDDKDYIINTLATFLYSNRKSSDKKTLWECFGDEIYENIKTNTTTLGNICPICGKRFKQSDPLKLSQVYCSDECSNIALRESKKEWARNNR